ncbi:MAG: HAMP domain-containing histidine kinase [Acidobacteria bacterium]|nr:HAMP domain-containing histidine kinase [Acidobacteriota bacterium]
MSTAAPSPEWLEAANRLATVARQLATIVHESNNLLQVISGNAEMLEAAGELSEHATKRARTIGEHARRASSLLTELLAFARDGDLDAARIDLGALVREAADRRRYAADRARIGIRVSGGEAAYVVANRRRTLQILLNLVANAETALAGCDRAAIDISVRREGPAFVVRVEDNGAGLPAPPPAFFVAPEARADSALPSLGIGLAVARWLAATQGGELRVDRRPDGGVVSAVWLPAADQALPAASPAPRR